MKFSPSLIRFYSMVLQINPICVTNTILTNCDWASSFISILSQATKDNSISNAYLIKCITKFLERSRKMMTGVNTQTWENERPKIQGLLAAKITYGTVENDALFYLLMAFRSLFAEKMSINFFKNEGLSLQIFGSLNQNLDPRINESTWKIFTKVIKHNLMDINNLLKMPGFSKPIEIFLHKKCGTGNIELLSIVTKVLPLIKNNNDVIALIHYINEINMSPHDAITRIKQNISSKYHLVAAYHSLVRSKPQLIQLFTNEDPIYSDSLLKKKRRKSKF